ncbi:MAG: discoidin domain-containing protein [Bacteroidota bacterium]
MRIIFTFLAVLAFTFLFGQNCPELIPQSTYSIHYVSSENGNLPAELALDGDSSTYFRTNGNTPFPHEFIIDLGDTLPLSQLGIRPRHDNANGRLSQFEIYTSNDTLNWGQAQAKSQLIYESVGDIEEKLLSFGAVEARYLRLLALSNEDPSNIHRWMVGELTLYRDSCTALGRANQTIDFPTVSAKSLTTGSIQLQATATSNLKVTYEVLDGPGSIIDDELSFTGEGFITVKAIQLGDASFYPTEHIQLIEVLDPVNYPPVLYTNLHLDYPIEMTTFRPYPMAAWVDQPRSDVFEMDSVRFEINGDIYPAFKDGEAWRINWKPTNYGFAQIYVTAVNQEGFSDTDTLPSLILSPSRDRTISTFSGDVIQFGGTNSRWLYGTFNLPQTVSFYDSLHAHFWTLCPNVAGGCDDWDRLAWIEVQKPSGEWVEIIRYITPYGKGCDHDIDLTDYLSILKGRVNFRMFIDTWGTGGWDVNLDLEYIQGQVNHPYADVDIVWKGTWDFGNPANLQPIPKQKVHFRPDGYTPSLHLVTTGHGWGANNTGNAAEFYPAIHHIHVDEVETFEQDLWAICNPNPDGCGGQFGTWQFPRAGWCPGAIANRYIYDLNPYLSQDSIELDYMFDSRYEDQCHVNNPDCISGVTCDNCNDGYNPHYRISANMITWYDSIPETRPLSALNNSPLHELVQDFSIVPNPNQGSFQLQTKGLQGQALVKVINIEGKVVYSQPFKDVQSLLNHTFSLQKASSGLYMVQIRQEGKVMSHRMIIP